MSAGPELLRKAFKAFGPIDISPEKGEQLNAFRTELSTAVDSLDLSMFTHRQTLDALAACDDHIREAQSHMERAAERLCEALLWQRDPQQLCAALPIEDEESDGH